MTKRPKWTKERRARFEATMAHKHLEAGIPDGTYKLESVALPSETPNVIYVEVNGALKRYVLRTMPVYIPEEKLEAGS